MVRIKTKTEYTNKENIEFLEIESTEPKTDQYLGSLLTGASCVMINSDSSFTFWFKNEDHYKILEVNLSYV